MKKTCLVTTLKDYVDNNSGIYDNMDALTVFNGKNDTNIIVSVYKQDGSYIIPSPGCTFIDGSTNPIAITTTGCNALLLENNSYEIHIIEPNNLSYLYIPYCHISTKMSINNLIKLKRYNYISLQGNFYEAITVKDLLGERSNYKLSNITLLSMNNLYGTLSDFTLSCGNPSYNFRLNLNYNSNISGDITGILTTEIINSIKNSWDEFTLILTGTKVSGSIESFVQKLRDNGLTSYPYSTTSEKFKIITYKSNITYKGQPTVQIFEGESGSLLWWTETTIRYNNETIEA